MKGSLSSKHKCGSLLTVRFFATTILGLVLLLSCASQARAKGNMPPGWEWPASDAMKARGEKCLGELSSLGVTWKKAKATNFITTPIVVPDMDFAGLRLEPTFRKGPFVMDCHLAVALAKLAPTLLQADVAALRFSSIHAIRKVRVGGKRKKSLSRHSLGLAVDVYEIRPAKGEILIVKKHYWKRPLASEVESLATSSDKFRTVLSPANDPKSHYDHLHFEASVGDKKRVGKRKNRHAGKKGRARARKLSARKVRAQKKTRARKVRVRKKKRARKVRARKKTRASKVRARKKARARKVRARKRDR